LDRGGSIAQLVPLQKLSATKESQVAERKSGLPFRTLGQVLENVPPEPDWNWQGYLAPSAVTLLAGRAKVGKSTLIFGLVAAIQDGDPFLDRRTR
jgi:AAA domain